MDRDRSVGRERGAVHIGFVVVAGILAIGGWFFFYTKSKESDELAGKLASATAEKWKVEVQRDAAIIAFKSYATLVQGEGITLEFPDVADEATWVAARGPFETKYSKADRFKAVSDRMGEIVAATGAKLDENQTLFAVMNTAFTKYEEARRNAQTEKEAAAATTAQLDALRKEAAKKDETFTENVGKAKADAQKQHTDDVADRERVETTLAQANRDRDKFKQDSEQAKNDLQARTLDLSQKVEQHKAEARVVNENLRIERERDLPDGRIIAVDERLGTAWIDLGARNVLRRGTRFKVYEVGKGAVKIPKGFVVVTNVEADMAECAVEGGAPVAQGDYITNPYYSKDRRTKFVFLGQLVGRFNNEIAGRMLESVGALVSAAVTADTDFLVIGEKADPDGPELTESPEYQRARDWGIEIIRSVDLETYLRM